MASDTTFFATILYIEKMMKNNKSYDVVVIGGGPAGSSTAGFLAKKGYKVILFEKEKFPRYHIGESLLPATTMGILNKLGVMEEVERYGFPRKHGGTFLWGKESEPWTFSFYRKSENDKKFGSHPEYLHSFQVERSVFDQMLLKHAGVLGVEVHEDTSFISLNELDAGLKQVEVKTRAGEIETIIAPYVIDASGRSSTIRKAFGERLYDPFFKNIAIYGYFNGGKRLAGERAGNILCVAFKYGWFWYIPLRTDLTSVGLILGREKYDELKENNVDFEEIYNAMIEQAPMIKEYLQDAQLTKQEPYNNIRVDLDYSYSHSQFSHNGIFLTGDAACFIDPVFSSGVHLATYAGYLAATAIDEIETGVSTYSEAVIKFEGSYRKEYSVFHRFLTSFYQIHTDHDSYFWEARKVLGNENDSNLDAFIHIVSGTSTTGNSILGSGDIYVSEIIKGEKSLKTLIKAVSDNNAGLSENDIVGAQAFMEPLHDSRQRLFEEIVDEQENSGNNS